MTSTLESVTFSSHCLTCGGVFNVDAMETTSSGLRLRLTIENTGEQGALNLLMENSNVFFLDEGEAAAWTRSYSWRRAQGRTVFELLKASKTFFGLQPAPDGELPRELAPGESWSGYFHSVRGSVDQASALVCTLGYFRQARTGNFCSHVTMDETRPFISLGRDVTLPEPSRLMRWTGRVMAFARCLWSLPVLGIVLGAIAGTLADVYLDTEPVFRLVGLFGGWYLFYQIARAR